MFPFQAPQTDEAFGAVCACFTVSTLFYAYQKAFPENAANRLYLNALEAADRGDHQNAKTLLLALNEQTPSEEVLCDLGLMHYRAGEYPQATLCFRQILDLNPHNIQALYVQALIFQTENRPELAQTCLQTLIQSNSADPWDRFIIGLTWLKLGYHEGEQRLLSLIIDHDYEQDYIPASEPVRRYKHAQLLTNLHFALAQLYEEFGQDDKMLEHRNHLANLAPQFHDLFEGRNLYTGFSRLARPLPA